MKEDFDYPFIRIEDGIFENNKIDSFYIGKYLVKQSDWKKIMGINPSYFRDSPHCPVENVSWNDVQEFVKRLNFLTGKQYRLPTESEWEFAAKEGKETEYYNYSGSNNVEEVAWHYDNSNGKTHDVGKKEPNKFGIYDMSGNVWEWCQDWFKGEKQGDLTGLYRVIRGGSWHDSAENCSVILRDFSSPDNAEKFIGFRLAITSLE